MQQERLPEDRSLVNIEFRVFQDSSWTEGNEFKKMQVTMVHRQSNFGLNKTVQGTFPMISRNQICVF